VDFCGHAVADPVGARFRNVEIPGVRVEGADWRTEPDALVEVIIHTVRRACPLLPPVPKLYTLNLPTTQRRFSQARAIRAVSSPSFSFESENRFAEPMGPLSRILPWEKENIQDDRFARSISQKASTIHDSNELKKPSQTDRMLA
jgi:hypothetical protein